MTWQRRLAREWLWALSSLIVVTVYYLYADWRGWLLPGTLDHLLWYWGLWYGLLQILRLTVWSLRTVARR